MATFEKQAAARPLPLGSKTPPLEFRGIVPPVITPLLEGETLDEPAFRQLIQKLLAADLPALFLCGTAGMGPALTDEVYIRTLHVALEEAGTRVPLLAGVMETSTARTLARLKLAESLGIAHAVISAPCFFSPRSEAEFVAHFRACAEAINMTIIPYNLPQYTGVSIPIEAVVTLWEQGLIGGMKESSGDPVYFEALCRCADLAGLPVFQGNRPDFARLVKIGAAGAVPVPANAEPKLFQEAWTTATAHGSVEDLQQKTDALWHSLVQGADFLSGTLRSLADEGIGQQRLPLPWISPTSTE